MVRSLRQFEFRQPSTCGLESSFLTQRKRLRFSKINIDFVSVGQMTLFAGTSV